MHPTRRMGSFLGFLKAAAVRFALEETGAAETSARNHPNLWVLAQTVVFKKVRPMKHAKFEPFHTSKFLSRLAPLAVATSLAAASPSACISLYESAPSPLRHAVAQLAEHTGLPLEKLSPNEPCVRIELNTNPNPRIGVQGYRIASAGSGGITIRGNDAEGAANGVYTLLRTLMIEHRKDPFSRTWNIEEKPQFSIRAIQVAPYRFGASFGFAVLSSDRWSFQQWKEYVDLMRLCNMTTLSLAPARVYDPEYPNSQREEWRYEIWKQVMDYCHQVGIKFNWMISPIMTSEQAFFDNPDKRGDKAGGAWFGNEMSWASGKDLILRNQKHTLEYFRGLDSLEIIYNDGGGIRPDIPDPSAAFADMTRSYLQLLRETGNNSNFVFWNWWMDLWAQGVRGETAKQYPKYRTIQDDIIPLLPKNVAWLDASALTQIQTFGHVLRLLGNPPIREGLLIGKENGFKPVIDFFWYMNPEHSINMFPHPYIQRGIQEAQYARDEIQADGAMGYRLAPTLRFIDDYIFFRLTSDPSLSQEQLVGEAAGLLCENAENREQAADAIHTLERFWTHRNLADLLKAEELFRTLLAKEKSKRLEYTSNAVTFLTYIARMAEPGISEARKKELKRQLWETVKPMYVFQGLTADIVWAPEALRFFSARVDMLVEDYQAGWMTSQNAEVVDRSLYPKAVSQPFTVDWHKSTASGGSHE